MVYIGVGVSVNGFLSLCVNPVIDWLPVHSVPHLSPEVTWDLFQLPCDTQWISSTENTWMDGRQNSVVMNFPLTVTEESRSSAVHVSASEAPMVSVRVTK